MKFRTAFLRILGPSLLCLFHLAMPAFAQSQDPNSVASQVIHVSVDRVNVGVIVTTSDGKFAEALRREDFHIFDNGAEQPLTDFAAIDEPAQVLLLVEAGPAVYLLEGGHLRAAHALLDGLSPGDRVAVVKYAEAPHPLLDFTPDKPSAGAALENLRFNVGFGMLNLSSSLSAVLDWLANVRGKKTMVLLSTGVDTSTEAEIAAMRTRLKTSDVRVLAISLSRELRTPTPARKNKVPSNKSAAPAKQFAEADTLLELIASDSGGRAYFPANAKEYADVYSQISQLVRHEYSLGFTPPVHDGQVHTIEVRVSGPAATPATSASPYRVDHRRAYLAPAP
jgi:Ca-activated chloride channel family protein